jgi:hypothetical protein
MATRTLIIILCLVLGAALALGGCVPVEPAMPVLKAENYLGTVPLAANRLHLNVADLRKKKQPLPDLAYRLELDILRNLRPPDPGFKGGKYRMTLHVVGQKTAMRRKTVKLSTGSEKLLVRIVNIDVMGGMNRPDKSRILAGIITGVGQTLERPGEPPQSGFEQAYRNLLHRVLMSLKKQANKFH